MWGAHSDARVSGIGVRTGDVLIRVSPDRRVTVNTRHRAGARDDQTVQQVRDAVTGLLIGLPPELAGDPLVRVAVQDLRAVVRMT
jgi:hypothetical protein